jgi:ferric-dicitrate binding protein FerR (iron transport regulator)
VTPDSPDDLILALLDRYIAGECTPAEAQRVREWVAAAPENRAALDEVGRVRNIAHSRPPARTWDAAWQRAVRELELGAETTHRDDTAHAGTRATDPRAASLPGIRSTARPRRWISIAIAASLLLGAASVVYRMWTEPPRVAATPAEPREYRTSRGQRATIQLSDGSQMTIGPASIVTVPAEFPDSSRTLTLAGEAYFKVRHDSLRPFRVVTKNGVVEDLGTAFVVSTADGAATQVVVSEGKVALGGKILTRGMLGRLDAAGRVGTRSNVDLDLHFAWLEGRLVFRDMPAERAFARLTRWYDIEFQLADSSLRSIPLTASFGDESIDQVLEAVDLALAMRHRTEGRRVIFYSSSGKER